MNKQYQTADKPRGDMDLLSTKAKDSSGKRISCSQLRQKQIEMRRNLGEKGEPVQNLFQRKYKEELELENSESKVNSIFQMYLDQQQEGQEGEEGIDGHLDTLLSAQEKLRDHSALTLYRQVLLLSSSPVVEQPFLFLRQPSCQLAALKNSLATFIYKYSPESPASSFPSLPLETLLSIYELYRQPVSLDTQPLFYLDLKDTLLCFTYHHSSKAVLVNTRSSVFLRFLKHSGVTYRVVQQHQVEEWVDLSQFRMSEEGSCGQSERG